MPLVDLSDPSVNLPEFLLLDASLLLTLRRGATHRKRAKACAFLGRVQKECSAGNMCCLVPLMTLEECYFKIIQACIENLTTNGWHRHYKRNPAVLQRTISLVTQFYKTVIALPATVVTPEDLALTSPRNTLEKRMRDFISGFNLLPKDAYLLAAAERLGVKHVATLDRDWNRAAREFTVYYA